MPEEASERPVPIADALLSQYDLYKAWVLHQDERRWTLLSAFVVVNGLFAATFYLEATPPLAQKTLAGLGVVNAILWSIIMWRNNFYLETEQRMAKEMEIAVLGKDSEFRFFTDDGSNIALKDSWTRQHVKSSYVIYAIQGIAGILWIAVLVDVW